MNDSTISLSADTSALTDSLRKIAEEMTAMKDAVSSSAAAMGVNLDASAKQAEATNAAIHGLDDSVKTVTDSIEAQTKTVTDLGTKQSKVWISDRDKALSYEVKPGEMLRSVHSWFARKSCPGNWLMERLGSLADEVNAKLGV